MRSQNVSKNLSADSVRKKKGIRLNQLNILLIILGLVISALMVYSFREQRRTRTGQQL